MSSSSSSAFSRLVTVPTTGSTNDDLCVALSAPDGRADPLAARDWPHLSALRARSQTAGRGRAGHVWTTPPDGALTVSVVLRPLVPVERLEWLPLLAGLAVQRTLEPRLEGAGWRVWTKWPNDVVALPEDPGAVVDLPGWGRNRKVAGVLCELVPAPARDGAGGRDPRAGAAAGVVGIGVNLTQSAADLPVPWAASLTGLGAEPARADAEEVLEDLGRHLADLVSRWESRDGDPDGGDGELGRRLRGACSTLGRDLVVTTPAGRVRGRAVDLRPGLVLRGAAGGPAGEGAEEFVVSTGEALLARLDSPA